MKSKSIVIILGVIAVIAIVILFLGFLFPKNFNGGFLALLAFTAAASVMIIVVTYIVHMKGKTMF